MPKILLADDSTHAQRMGTKILAAEGIEVVTASNGEAALKKLGETEVDLILADVYMPGLDGYEVCQWVKKSPEYAHIPVVLVVGALELYEPDKVAQVQADGLLKKPFEATAMIDTLRPLMDVAVKAREKKKPKKAAVEDAPEEKTVRLGSSPIQVEEPMPTPAPVETVEVPAEMGDIPFGMDMSQEPAPSGTSEIDLASVEFAMPSVEPAEGTEVTIPTEFQETPPATTMARETVAEPPAQEPAPEPAPSESVYGVESALEVPVEAPAEAPSEVMVEETPKPEAALPEPPPPPPAPPEPTPHWVAEPAEVTKQDQALFEPAAAPAKPEAPPDWNELLKSVEEPAAAPAAVATAAAAAVKEEEPPPPPPPPAPVKVDEESVRTAVHLCLENALPTLVEDITASIIRRLNK